MSAETGEGAGSSALVLEQRMSDLCHDEIFEHGTGTEVAYDLIANELLLDGSARLNLATFVTTWMMPPAAAALMGLTADKNMIDKDEYPQTAEIERRCVNIIGPAGSPGGGHRGLQALSGSAPGVTAHDGGPGSPSSCTTDATSRTPAIEMSP